MKKIAIAAAVLLAAWQVYQRHAGPSASLSADNAFPSRNISARATSGSATALAEAYQSRARDIQVEGEGVVLRVLPDDNEGSRHQRFIVRLGSGQTVLIAHNIDLAPRVEPLESGAQVSFHGEYEWNERGGVIHWTHHDPSGRHPAGWISHAGRRFQ